MFTNLTLAQRITAGFAVMVLMLIGITWTGNTALQSNQHALDQAVNADATKIRDTARMVQNLLGLQRAEKNLILSRKQSEMDEYQLVMEQEEKELRDRLKVVSGLVDREGASILDQFEREFNQFRAVQKEVVELSRENGNVRARELSQEEARQAYDRASAAMEQIVNLNDSRGERLSREAEQSGEVVRLSARTVQDLLAISRAEKNLIQATTQDQMDEFARYIEQNQNEMRDRREQLRDFVDEDGKEILDHFAEVWDQYLEINREVRNLTRQNGNVRARELSQGEAREAFDRAATALKNLVDEGDRRADHAVDLKEAKAAAERIKLAARMARNLVEIQRGEKNLILARSQQEMDEYAAAIEEIQNDLQARAVELQTQLDAEERRLFERFQNAYEDYLGLHKQVRELSRLNSNSKAAVLSVDQGRPLLDRAEQLLSRLTNKNDREQELLLMTVRQSNEKVKLAARINRNLTEIQRGEKNLILSRTQQEMDEYAQLLSEIALELEQRLQELGQILRQEESAGALSQLHQANLEKEQAALGEFTVAYRNYRTLHQQVRELSRLNSNARAFDLSADEGRKLYERAEATLKRLVTKVDQDMEIALDVAVENFDRSQNTSHTLAIIGVLFSIMVAFFVIRTLNNRTQQLAERARQIAIGEVVAFDESSTTQQDELTVIERSLEEIQGAFSQIVELATTMSTGAYGAQLAPRSQNDTLVQSLNLMSEGLSDITDVVNTVAQGDYRSDVVTRSEQDRLGLSMQQMLASLREIADVAVAVVENDFSVRVTRRGEDDQLAPAMNQMIINLGEVITTNQSQSWVQEGVVALSAAVRGEQRGDELASNAITALCDYLGVQVGALYTVRTEEESDERKLHLLGSYAYSERKNLSNVFAFGESLVGQAALENQPIVVQQVPEDYIKVSSGLGESTPHNIIVQPFSFEGEVRGVIELGSVEPLSEDQREVLNRVVDTLGIAFQSAAARTELDQALKDSQTLTEELQTQQEELQETNEQLEEQTQALEVSQKDVEERNRRLEAAQEELNERAEQLQQSSKYKSEFLANMSHELRTPLNSILLLSKMIAGGDVDSEDEQRNNAQVIHDAGTDLLGLINEVLDLSKIEAGKMSVHLSTIEIEEFANSFRALFEPQATEKGLDFEVAVDEDLPESFRCDRDRLQQVLRNFLSNAMKFTESGEIKVRAAPVDDGVARSLVTFGNLREKLRERPEDYLVFSVVDTGIGIPQDKRQLVFEAFQQADGSTSRTYGGTGLGLSISNQIAEMLEGALGLESSVGAGSTFSVVVPISPSVELNTISDRVVQMEQEMDGVESVIDIAAPTMGKMIQDDQMVTSSSDERILLIIEDDPRFAQTLLDLGHQNEFKVIHASTGTEGVRLAEHYLPTAILLDIQLPILDGWGVLRHLKKNPDTSHIPVHIISVMDEQQFGFRLGAAQYLVKPVDPADLDKAFSKIEDELNREVRQLLVVEDNQIERESIIKLLQCDHDIECTGVGTGGEALKELRTNRYDAFILDLRLPDMTGYDVLKQVAEDSAIERIATIVYTGKDLSLEDEKQLRVYAESIVLKTAESPARLLEETTIFLHRVRSNLSEEKQQLLAEISKVDGLLTGRTVLLVDDDIRNTFALSAVLEKKGLKVLTAADGKESLEMLERNADEIELVLMDIMMPVMDGYEAMREIRKQKRFEHLPVIALTAKALKEDRDLCIAAGASDYMTKPVDHDQLFSLIRVWLSTKLSN